MTKRFLSCFVCLFVLCSFLSACNFSDGLQEGTIRIVATTFPLYDWTRRILGDKADTVTVTMLLDGSTDLHSYQPVAADIAAISACDLFLYNGGESDDWVKSVLQTTVNKDREVIDLLTLLGDAVRMEEALHEEQLDEAEQDDEVEVETDEHAWLSLKNAISACSHIAQTLGKLDSQNAAVYAENAAAYCKKLEALDAQYQAAVAAAPVRTLLFADRFPFLYLTQDYDLSHFEAFSGCSAETEASFQTIAFLADKLDEYALDSVLVTESSDQSIAKTVIQSSKNQNRRILVLNSMQSVTASSVAAGTSYLSIMESNLSVLKQALEKE